MAAVGLIRVSRVKGREGESFVSPVEQTDRITAWCRDNGVQLLEVIEELDVSGGASLEDRPGLSAALDRIETGKADTLVVAFFDRLFRSMTVQFEVLDRIFKAGGRIAATDIGLLTDPDEPGEFIHGSVMGMAADLYRRQVKKRSAEAQRRAIDRGVATWDVRLPGYTKGPDGVLIPDELAPIVREAFTMRRDGATIAAIREYLGGHGINRSYHGVTCLLRSRVYLGELHFGNLENLNAHQPIIDRDLWNTVQRTKISRGRRAKSDRLLARLGVLVCGTCGSRMTVGTVRDGSYPFYRCPPTGDCPKRQTISARIVEGVVVEAVKQEIREETGTATHRTDDLADRLEAAQTALDNAIQAFDGLMDEPAAIRKLAELRATRDALQLEHDDLRLHHVPTLTLTAADWDDLTLDGQRALIKAVVKEIRVDPGTGPDRVTIQLFEG